MEGNLITDTQKEFDCRDVGMWLGRRRNGVML
jgi:hypothetical protein